MIHAYYKMKRYCPGCGSKMMAEWNDTLTCKRCKQKHWMQGQEFASHGRLLSDAYVIR